MLAAVVSGSQGQEGSDSTKVCRGWHRCGFEGILREPAQGCSSSISAFRLEGLRGCKVGRELQAVGQAAQAARVVVVGRRGEGAQARGFCKGRPVVVAEALESLDGCCALVWKFHAGLQLGRVVAVAKKLEGLRDCWVAV